MKKIETYIIMVLFLMAKSDAIIRADLISQVVVSPTPVQVSLPSPLPFLTEVPLATEVSATRTPTPQGAAVLEAITEANVRSQPDPGSERLGVIRKGDLFPIIGRYFRWYQFQYDQSPRGTGWVFDELVTIIGDQASIIDLAADITPTPPVADTSSTLEVLTLTPGGFLTATSDALSIPLPGQLSSQVLLPPTQPASVLPTFTYPANLLVYNSFLSSDAEMTLTPTTSTNIDTTPARFPPILPILIFAGGGILGLIFGSLWRSNR